MEKGPEGGSPSFAKRETITATIMIPKRPKAKAGQWCLKVSMAVGALCGINSWRLSIDKV
jgi:hypothetical protein